MTIDLTGQQFGRLTVLKRAENQKRAKWLCQCKCGGAAIASAYDLKRGHTQSCGCLQKERTKDASVKHGKRHTKIYHIWLDIKNRCYNPNNKRYANYHGRGITVCDEWKDDFMAFYNYVSKLTNYGMPGYSIDRIDNDAGYKPGNIRWATVNEQLMNRTVTIKVIVKGKETTLPELSKTYGIKYPTLLFHYKRQDLEQYLERKEVNGAKN